MINKIIFFVLLNFLIAFASDLVLNYLSTNYGIVGSLKPYFQKKSVVGAGVYAGLTILFALLINMLLSYLIFGFTIPSDNRELLYFSILAFILGYIIDVLIYKLKIFGDSLDLFYKEVGAGLWGSLAFLFTIVISFVILKFIK